MPDGQARLRDVDDGSLDLTLIADNSGCMDTLVVPVAIYIVPSAVAAYSISPEGMLTAWHSDSIHATTWRWGLGNENSEGDPSVQFDLKDYLEQDTVYLYLFTQNLLGCFDDTLMAVTIPTELGKDRSEAGKILFYPNPTSGIIRIITQNSTVNFELFTMQGVCLMKREPVSSSHELDLRNLQKGIYLLRIGNRVYRILKE